MQKYLYILSDTSTKNLQVGMSGNIVKTINFYKNLPSLKPLYEHIHSLVYLEEFTTEEQLLYRFKEVTLISHTDKKMLIESVNPDWIELIPGVNIEL